MFVFWIAAAALSALAGWLMLHGARIAAARAGAEDPALAVHRRQLAEIDDLAARGLLPESEVKAARAEAGRRLLAAAGAASATPAPQSGRRGVVVAAILAPLAALALYLATGSPGFPDQPFARRVDEWRHGDPSRLDPPRMAAVLRGFVAEHPNDPDALRNLALAELLSNNPSDASAALRRAVALAPQRADLWVALGEAFMAEGEGRVYVDARKVFGEALKRDPGSLAARYHLAQADMQDGDVAKGLAGWRALLADLPAGDPRRQGLMAEIAAVERDGPPRVGAPPAAGPPNAAAIRGMVEGLAARLEGEPNDPEGWVRLVRSWGVLGEIEKRDAALKKAKTLFKEQPQVLQALDQAAEAPR